MRGASISTAHRQKGNLVTVNVAAIPQTMFEREFFGHVKGAFSGADRDGEGYAARANGGTLFLDEIGDLPLEAQPKLVAAPAGWNLSGHR